MTPQLLLAQRATEKKRVRVVRAFIQRCIRRSLLKSAPKAAEEIEFR
jgi:hypothetical protein